MFPRQKEYQQWLSQIRHYSQQYVEDNEFILNDFYAYYADNHESSAVKQPVNVMDIRAYVDHLINDRQLKPSTINKYTSHLKRYFDYMYDHQFIKVYPLVNLRGITLNRHRTYKINWQRKIPQMLDLVKPDTIKVLVAIACGFKPDELLSLTYQSLVTHLHDTSLKEALEKHSFFPKTLNHPLLSDRRYVATPVERPISSKLALVNRIKSDEKVLQLNLKFSYLRNSFIYSQVIRPDLTGEELKKILRCNSKSLAYYQANATKTELIPYQLPANQ